MTPKEAIKILNPDADVVWKAYDGKDLERCNEACRVACVALAKQIPKKPDEVYDEYDYFVCPCCKESIYSSTGDVTDHKFCLECGQALDWNDKNDL